jgi:hypothetical protein
MKYKAGNFLQLNREIFNGKYNGLSWQAKWLYTVLTELEHRYTGKKMDFFFRSIKDLEKDTGMTSKTIRKYRQELEAHKLIFTWKMHWWMDDEQTQKSEKYVTAFRILR